MPYSQKQAKAVFLNIKRRKGEKAAKEFGRKHAEYLRNPSKNRAYLNRARREN